MKFQNNENPKMMIDSDTETEYALFDVVKQNKNAMSMDSSKHKAAGCSNEERRSLAALFDVIKQNNDVV